jgi:hypothetical protein
LINAGDAGKQTPALEAGGSEKGGARLVVAKN